MTPLTLQERRTEMIIRHGDMALKQIDQLPDGLKASKSKVLMVGSGGNDHAFDKGTFYPHRKGDFVVGYFEATDKTKLLHPDHGQKHNNGRRTCDVSKGIYEVRKQVEDTHEGMRPVED
jgi:hypothetical protein